MRRLRGSVSALCVLVLSAAAPGRLLAQAPAANHTSSQPSTTQDPQASDQPPDNKFDMGEIVVIGSPEGQPGVGGALLSREQIWNFDRVTLDQAVNVVPGVVSNFDSNGRRNESDIFVRGFG